MNCVSASLSAIGLFIVMMPMVASAQAASTGVAYIDACAKVLVPDDINYQSSDVVKMALLNTLIIDDSNSKTLDSDASAYAGLFKGGEQGVENARKRLSQSFNYKLNHDQEISLLASFLSPNVTDAFTECVKDTLGSTKDQVFLMVLSTSLNETDIGVTYSPSGNNDQHLHLSIAANGKVKTVSYRLPLGRLQNPQTVEIVRTNPGVDLDVTVSILNPDRTLKSSAKMFRYSVDGATPTWAAISAMDNAPSVIRARAILSLGNRGNGANLKGFADLIEKSWRQETVVIAIPVAHLPEIVSRPL